MYRRSIPKCRIERYGGGGEYRRTHSRTDRRPARRTGVRQSAEREPFPLCFDGKRVVDAYRGDSTGRVGGLRILAGHPFDTHSDHRHHRLAGWHVRCHVAVRVLD